MRPLLIASVVAFASALTLAQTPAPGQNPPKFIGGIDVVKLDVSVYDKDHRPIKGLTAADFTVLEDKLPRPIVGLAEVDIPEPPVPTATWMRDAPTDVTTNDVTEKRLFLIVIDDGSFGGGGTFDPPQYLKFKVNLDTVIRVARGVIDRLGPTDLAALVFVNDGRFNQEFTGDHSRLIAAVEKTLKDPPLSLPNDAMGLFYETVNNLINAPAKRKAIVDITGSLRCLMGPRLTTAERVFTAAQRAGVRFYMMRPAEHI